MNQDVRLLSLQRMGVLLTLLSLAVVGVSAWLRLDGVGLGCTDWPACYASFLNGAAYSVPPVGRIIHRIVATSALLLAFYVCWSSLKPTPLQPVVRQALLLTGLMLLLSVAGIWSDDPRRVFVNFVNILGGVTLVSFSWRLVLATTTSPPRPANQHNPLLTAGLLTLTMTVLLGALIGARYAAVACTDLLDCGGTWWPSRWSGINPLVMLSGPISLGDPEGVALHLLHRYCAVITVPLLGVAAWRVLKESAEDALRRYSATLVMVLLAGEVVLGMLTVVSGFSLGLAIAHNIGAAALLAATVRLTIGSDK